MIPYEKRGCVISLDNSWRITVDHRMHITCCACAYQLLCKRTTVVVRPKILSFSTTYTMFFNNISVIFQQKEGESLTYDTPSFLFLFKFSYRIFIQQEIKYVHKYDAIIVLVFFDEVACYSHTS